MWRNTETEMPLAGKLYWITDGENIALATWSIKNMWWRFLWHNTVFRATHFTETRVPEIPND